MGADGDNFWGGFERVNIEVDAILKPGDTCWKAAKADRAAFLIDAASYFSAFAASLREARYVVYIAGWDFDSRISLLHSPGTSLRLGDLLYETAARTPELRIYILCWEHFMIHAMKRKWAFRLKMGWKNDRRIRFHIDNEHPIGACQHQKFVLIDNSVAFCGGMDLTGSRWDTPSHRSDDHRRQNPDGKHFGPVHDVQMVVDGAAAALLGPVFQQRWSWATGERLERKHQQDSTPWPESIKPDLKNVRCAVSRTYPAFKGHEEVREVARLYEEAISAAQRHIYMESQYLTSGLVSNALSKALKKPDGPEIVLVLPRESSDWIEQSAMDAIRLRILKQLFRHDRYGRLRIFYPVTKDGRPIYVHSKLMVVDDRFVRIGSSNLSNRSMGFDSECDLSAEGVDRETKSGVSGLLHTLLAEHLGTLPKVVSERFRNTGSLIQCIKSLKGSGRTLTPLDVHQDILIDGLELVEDPDLLDPKEPVRWDRIMDLFAAEDNNTVEKMPLLKPVLVIAFLIALACIWRWSPLSEYIRIETLTGWVQTIKGRPIMPLIVVGGFVVGGLFMVPVSVLIVSTAVIFPPFLATVYALTGCLLSALAGYGAGTMLGKEAIGKFSGRKLRKVSQWLRKPGPLSVVIIRNVPLAPYSAINYLAGALHIKLMDYLLGTAVGIAPGIIVISVFTDQVLLGLKSHNWMNFAFAVLAALGLGIGIWWIRKRTLRRTRHKEVGE